MNHETNKKFHEILKQKADEYAFLIYKSTNSFPREEIYGITSQIRRASLSVALNNIEGYARMGDVQYRSFLRISYGSLRESQYLLNFSLRLGYLEELEFNKLLKLGDELGAMLWSTISRLNEKCEK